MGGGKEVMYSHNMLRMEGVGGAMKFCMKGVSEVVEHTLREWDG